tara:strand:+ start:4639 stop:5004 length:366 start_codon:yes stop_codon:yes gene_type:complete
MKKQKIVDINNIEEESGGPNFIYTDDNETENIRQYNIDKNKKTQNIITKWQNLAKRFINLTDAHKEYLFSLQQITAWNKLSKERLLKLQECCTLRGHGQIESDRQPHERITYECLFCGKYI